MDPPGSSGVSAAATRDPVCKMRVNGESPKWTSVHKETVYAFCSLGCKRLFDVNPDRYSKSG